MSGKLPALSKDPFMNPTDPWAPDSQGKSVVLYNPISGTGHFDSWCELFAGALLSRGWRVHVITPDGTRIEHRMRQAYPSARGALKVYDRTSVLRGPIPCESPIGAMRSAAISALRRRHHRSPAKAQGAFTRAAQRALEGLTHSALRVLTFLLRHIHAATHGLFNQRLDISNTSPLAFARDVNLVAASARLQKPVVLNLYVDLYSADYAQWHKFGATMRHPWAGLNIDLTNSLPDGLLGASRTLRALLYINEDTVDFPASPSQRLEYAWIPDVANDDLPEDHTELANEILHRAAGRKIVFLGGAIGGTKNLSTWYQAIRLADPTRWYFIQIGAINQSTLTTADRLNLQQVLDHYPENLLIQDRYLPDERAFNELIAISDVVWGLYRDFDRSSNVLGKAAVFQRPVIVSDRFLMGKRVRDYRIGAAIAEDSPEAVVIALDELNASPVPASCFERYIQDFGYPALSRRLDDTLMRVLADD